MVGSDADAIGLKTVEREKKALAGACAPTVGVSWGRDPAAEPGFGCEICVGDVMVEMEEGREEYAGPAEVLS